MEPANRNPFSRIFFRASKRNEPTVANAAPVDAETHPGQGVRVGQRIRRARRKVAPSLFDNCAMARVSSFAIGSEIGGLWAHYEIRQAEDGKGRKLLCREVFDGGVELTLAEARATYPNECTCLPLDGLDFRAIVTLAGETYLVVRKPSTVAPSPNVGDESGDLFNIPVNGRDRPL